MKNFVQTGLVLSVAAPYAVSGGQLLQLGAIIGVAQHDAAVGAPVEIARIGVFDLTKVVAQAWSAGDPIYWDNAARRVTTVQAGTKLIGAAAMAAANPSETGRVLLDGTIR
jgi:predicted RecA/RadA family phage recombinase